MRSLFYLLGGSMQNFYYDIPTKIAFGKGEIAKLPKFVKEFGNKVLIV